jgi:hypothetical protein
MIDMMKSGRKLLTLFLAAALALSLVACSSTQGGIVNEQGANLAASGTEQSPDDHQRPGENTPPDGKGGQFDGTAGKITSIDGTTVTVALGELSGGPGGRGGPGRKGGPSGNQQGDGQTPPSSPDGNQQGDGQTPPSDADKGERPSPGFTESGKTLTLDLSLITKDGNAVTAEDLREGDLLLLTLDDSGAATEARLLNGGPMGGPKNGDGPQSAPSEEDSAPAGENTPDQAEGSIAA